jgi:hypothetical protein
VADTLSSGRQVSQWMNLVPDAVADGSRAMIVHALRDARTDIAGLIGNDIRHRAELAEARAQITALTAERDEARAAHASVEKELHQWIAAHRKLARDHYEQPWTVNEAARERMRAEATETRARELAAALKRINSAWNKVPSGKQEAADLFAWLISEVQPAITAARALLNGAEAAQSQPPAPETHSNEEDPRP